MRSKAIFVTALSSLLLTCNTFAAKQDQCPPQAWIEQAHFTKAIRFMSKIMWGLYTDNFQFNGKPWNIAFITPLRSPEENSAISEGQHIFNTEIKLSSPEMQVDGDKIFCIYVQGKTYAVMATTPPWPMAEQK